MVQTRGQFVVRSAKTPPNLQLSINTDGTERITHTKITVSASVHHTAVVNVYTT